MPANRSDTGGKEKTEGPQRPAAAEAGARVTSRYARIHPGMYKFRVRDRHNPLPHIALLTTALKSIYEYAFLSTRTVAEVRELLDSSGPE